MRRLAVTLIVVLTALAAASCGAEDAADRLDPVAEAADKTLATGGATVTGTGKFTSQGVDMTMTLDGEVDFEESAFAYSMDFGEVTGVSDKELDAMRKELGMPLEFVQKDDVVYVTADPLEEDAGVEIEEKWVKIDLGELSEDALPGLEQLSGANETNPAEMLRFLKVTGDAKKVGTRTVRGTPTTEYRAAVDLRKAADLVPEDEREEFRKTIDRVAKAQGGYEFDAQVFVDRDGLIRRERIAFDDEIEGEAVKGAMTIDFQDFGSDVSVSEPDDVRDVTDEVAGALG